MMRWLALVVIVLVTAWPFRAELALGLASALIEGSRDVGPPRDVEWASGPDSASTAASDRPPNIVLILADDMGWNDVSTHGGGAGGGSVQTPHIDALAAEGVDFTAGYSANGTCAPSRAAILSGRYGTRFGFEFTPTPSIMMPMVRLVRSASGALADRHYPPLSD